MMFRVSTFLLLCIYSHSALGMKRISGRRRLGSVGKGVMKIKKKEAKNAQNEGTALRTLYDQLAEDFKNLKESGNVEIKSIGMVGIHMEKIDEQLQTIKNKYMVTEGGKMNAKYFYYYVTAIQNAHRCTLHVADVGTLDADVERLVTTEYEKILVQILGLNTENAQALLKRVKEIKDTVKTITSLCFRHVVDQPLWRGEDIPFEDYTTSQSYKWYADVARGFLAVANNLSDDVQVNLLTFNECILGYDAREEYYRKWRRTLSSWLLKTEDFYELGKVNALSRALYGYK